MTEGTTTPMKIDARSVDPPRAWVLPMGETRQLLQLARLHPNRFPCGRLCPHILGISHWQRWSWWSDRECWGCWGPHRTSCGMWIPRPITETHGWPCEWWGGGQSFPAATHATGGGVGTTGGADGIYRGDGPTAANPSGFPVGDDPATYRRKEGRRGIEEPATGHGSGVAGGGL